MKSSDVGREDSSPVSGLPVSSCLLASSEGVKVGCDEGVDDEGVDDEGVDDEAAVEPEVTGGFGSNARPWHS